MTRAAQLRDMRAEIVKQLVATFDASGVEYTSAAAVHFVVRNDAILASDRLMRAGFRVNPGPLIRDAVDAIHARYLEQRK